MAEQAGDDGVDSALAEGSAAEWAVERAADLDLDPHEFLERIMHAYRAAETETDATATVDDEALDALRDDVEALEADLDEMIQDVRERVIQVKRETDGKAPANHSHEALEKHVKTVRADLDELTERLKSLENRVEGGFENFEEILTVLVQRTDDIADDIETLGSAMVAMKESLETMTGREQGRARADRLKNKAAKRGVSKAKCEECGSKVDLAMLSDASCPTCDTNFKDIDPNPGFFGSSVLETGSRPALEAPSDVPTADEIDTVASGTDRAVIPDSDDWFEEAEPSESPNEEEGDDEQ